MRAFTSAPAATAVRTSADEPATAASHKSDGAAAQPPDGAGGAAALCTDGKRPLAPLSTWSGAAAGAAARAGEQMVLARFRAPPASGTRGETSGPLSTSSSLSSSSSSETSSSSESPSAGTCLDAVEEKVPLPLTEERGVAARGVVARGVAARGVAARRDEPNAEGEPKRPNPAVADVAASDEKPQPCCMGVAEKPDGPADGQPDESTAKEHACPPPPAKAAKPPLPEGTAEDGGAGCGAAAEEPKRLLPPPPNAAPPPPKRL
mmetsp:Transcript_28772/g.67459  ORF Transcript_28772/g.67459 Transcript_28772/m.67459 type:complete len:263 (+) Transcript_28772:952-1740(+)